MCRSITTGIVVLPTITSSDITVRGLTGSAIVRVYSDIGQLLISKQNVHNNDPINISNFAAAAYIVQVVQDGKVVNVTRVIKK